MVPPASGNFSLKKKGAIENPNLPSNLRLLLQIFPSVPKSGKAEVKRAVLLARLHRSGVPLRNFTGSSEREGTRVENRVWSHQEDHGGDRRIIAASTCGPRTTQLNCVYSGAEARTNVECHRLAKVVFSDESGLFGDSKTVYGCGGVLLSRYSPRTVHRHTARTLWLILPGEQFPADNARRHTARVTQDFLRHFRTLPWTARSSRFVPPVDHGEVAGSAKTALRCHHCPLYCT
ncbi:hypothetical protein TNCV_1642921 [Trichonephila clavipes]|nr:hypothetical protein TNCV_1642921 [Trichonephila clavipes]